MYLVLPLYFCVGACKIKSECHRPLLHNYLSRPGFCGVWCVLLQISASPGPSRVMPLSLDPLSPSPEKDLEGRIIPLVLTISLSEFNSSVFFQIPVTIFKIVCVSCGFRCFL